MTQLTQQGLLWQLFLMIKELMPATAENTKRQTEWAESFRALDDYTQSVPQTAANNVSDGEPVHDEDEDEPEHAEHPIEHARRTSAKPVKKPKR